MGKVSDYYFGSKDKNSVPRVDTIGEKLGLTHTINKNVLLSIKKANRRIKYAGIYNLVDRIIYRWNNFLNKLKIGE
jgi:hypothetical protein